MTKALLNRRLRQLHLWLGLAIGGQIGLWLISGLFMTWFPIEQVRGEHLRAEQPAAELVWSHYQVDLASALTMTEQSVEEATAVVLNSAPVWRLKGDGQTILVDARGTEGVISPLNDRWAKKIAVTAYAGRGQIENAELLLDPPQEYGRAGPVWRIDFGPSDRASFYVDASTGEVQAVRTLLWRTFDFMWGLHIMDWSSRENFNSWWIKMTASLAVLFFLAGLGILILRVIGLLQKSN